MAKNIFIGVNNVAKKPKNIYVGVNGVARKVKAAYVGVNGVARKVWPNNLIPDDSYQSLDYLGCTSFMAVDTGIATLPVSRVVMKFKFNTNIDIDSVNYTLQYDAYGVAGQALVGSNGTGVPANVTSTSYYYVNQAVITKTYGGTIPYFGFFQGPRLNDEFPYFFHSNTSEGILINALYTLDFMNDKKVYLYCEKGFYSISSNNLIGTYKTNWEAKTNSNNLRIQWPTGQSTSIYTVKIYNSSGTLIRDYIPAYRVSDGVVGLYDFVTRVFYNNTANINKNSASIIIS